MEFSPKEKMNKKDYIVIGLGIFVLISVIIAYNTYYILEPGYMGIHTRLGSVRKVYERSGLYFKLPFIDYIYPISSVIQKFTIHTEALSHDLQFVAMEVAINFKITDAERIVYEIGLGDNLYTRIIEPTTQETMKAVIAQYTAEELIQKRNDVNKNVSQDLRQRLAEYPIVLIDFNFVHLDFHKDFIRAVEEKQIAMQSAMTAKNLTERVKEEAIQTRTVAEAEAYAMKAKQNSATREIILLQAIKKWDGKLPRIITGDQMSLLMDSK